MEQNPTGKIRQRINARVDDILNLIDSVLETPQAETSR